MTRDFDFEALFETRRMVLVLRCGADGLLQELKQANVPAVGLDSDPECVERLRRSGHAAWVGDWRTLADYRERVDLIRMPIGPGEREVLGDVLATLEHALLPSGSILLETGDWLPDVESFLPRALKPRATQGLRMLLEKPGRVFRPSRTSLAPYADAFVGCRDVLEIEPGAGHFLSALGVRDVKSIGVAADPAALLEHAERHDGVYCGNIFDRLPTDEIPRLLAFALAALRPGGRLVARIAKSSKDPDAICATCRAHGMDRVGWELPVADSADALVFGVKRDLESVPEFLRARHTAADGAALLENRAPLPVDVSDRAIDAPLESLHDLERFEHREFSQGGEDGILAAIFALIGTTNRYYVEFGCGDGVQCNTRALHMLGWTGLLMDGMAEPATDDVEIHAEWIDADNIDELFELHGVPPEPDLVSIDLDGNDYWVWRALASRPRVVVIEYNANISIAESLVMPYDPDHRWNGTDYYGASLRALAELGHAKGYHLVYCNRAGVNAFFVRADQIPGFEPRPLEDVYQPPNFWYRGYRQVPDLGRRMVAPE